MGWLNQISGFASIFPEMFDTAWDNISPGLPFIGDAQQFNYQKRLQQKIFEREDNAVQRRVADLRAAGLSPTLAAGSSAGAGSPIPVTKPDYLNDMLKMMLYKQSQETIKQTQAQTSLLKAQEQKIYPEIQHIKSQAKQADSTAYLNYKAAKLREAETQLKGLDYSKGQYDYLMSKEAGMSTSPQGFSKNLLDITGTFSKILGTHPDQQLNNQTKSAISGITGSW